MSVLKDGENGLKPALHILFSNEVTQLRLLRELGLCPGFVKQGIYSKLNFNNCELWGKLSIINP